MGEFKDEALEAVNDLVKERDRLVREVSTISKDRDAWKKRYENFQEDSIEQTVAPEDIRWVRDWRRAIRVDQITEFRSWGGDGEETICTLKDGQGIQLQVPYSVVCERVGRPWGRDV